MVSSVKNEEENNLNLRVTKNKNSRKKKLCNVLKKKKFFIFIKNHSVYSKYEAKLKTLGAIISPFLDRDVNYILTDIPGCYGKLPAVADTSNLLSPSCYSVSPVTSVSGDDCCTTKKSRTRAEAMLERVPVQTPVISSISPIANAVSWNIPLYSVDFFLKWLDKKLSHFQLVDDRKDVKRDHSVKNFDKKFLKLENSNNCKYRPEFKEVSKWPCIDINTPAGSCPFDKRISKQNYKKEKNHEDKKKESERMNRTCNKSVNESGYCEICAIHFSDLSQHLTTNTHLKFICDDKNYVDLDNCIKTRSIDAFITAHQSSNNFVSKENTSGEMGRNLRKSVSLHLNNNENSAVTRSISNSKLLTDESLKQPLQVQCNGYSNYHLRKSAIKSDGALFKSPGYFDGKDLLRESRKMYVSCPEAGNNNQKDLSQLSPIGDDSFHRLRSRKSLLLPAVLLGTTAEDDSVKNKSILVSPQTPTSNHFLRSSISPKTQSVCHPTRSKFPPSEMTNSKKSNAVLHSPPLQKVTDCTNSVASAYFTRSKLNNISPTDSDTKKSTRSPSLPKEDVNRVNLKLNKRKHSIIFSDDEERRDSLKVLQDISPYNFPSSYQCNKKSVKNDSCFDISVNECNSADKVHRKRLSMEEKFLEDNKEYYKVEMLRTKLRSTEYYCNHEINQSTPKEENKSTITTTTKMAHLNKSMSDNKEPVVIRFKKIRNSALTLLNMEAENFMFGPPKKPEYDNEESCNDSIKTNGTEDNITDEEEKEKSTTAASAVITEQLKNFEDSTKGNRAFLNKQVSRWNKKKKRRTHAELFIHDNLDYYKFEISGPRLRNQTVDNSADTLFTRSSTEEQCESINSANVSSSSSSSLCNSSKADTKEELLTDEEAESCTINSKKQIKNNKKNLPNSGVKEIKEENEDDTPVDCNIDVHSCCLRPKPPDSLQFSFESVPFKESWYQTFRRLDTCDEVYIPLSDSFSRPYYELNHHRNAEKINVIKPDSSIQFSDKKRKKLSRFIIDDKPRKSPRCHASTLAILSSLTSHRRRSKKLNSSELSRGQSEMQLHKEYFDTSKMPLFIDCNDDCSARLKEAIDILAKDVDDYFIEIFSKNDCCDKYLEKFDKVSASVNQDENITNKDDSVSLFRNCLQFDDEMLQDLEYLECFSNYNNLSHMENMALFIENSNQCTSMENALDEDTVIPRTNDLLFRLYRENDFSCNSSDCGASSTCEFLGFAEDGHTVSRKRKRKKPNLTGWPHGKRKKTNVRFFSSKRDYVDDAELESMVKSPSINDDTASDIDLCLSDEDNVPLNQIIIKKKKCLNSTLKSNSSGIQKESTTSKNESDASTICRVSLRRSAKNYVAVTKSSLPVTKRLSNSPKNSKYYASYSARRSKQN